MAVNVLNGESEDAEDAVPVLDWVAVAVAVGLWARAAWGNNKAKTKRTSPLRRAQGWA